MDWDKIHKVLVTSARTPSATDMILRLQKAGFEVHAADSIKFPMGRWPAGRYLKYCSPTKSLMKFEQDLLSYIQDQGIDIILPNAEETFYLSLIKKKIELHCSVFVDDISLLKQLHHKREAGELLESRSSIELNIPKSLELVSLNDSIHLEEFVLKKNYSRFGEETYLEVTQELIQQKLSQPDADEYFLQQKLLGHEISTYGWYEGGELLQHVCYESGLRFSKAAIHFQRYEDQGVDSILRQIGMEFGLSGQYSFDLMKNEDGIWLIECNPRATSGVHLIRHFPFETQAVNPPKNLILGPPIGLTLMDSPKQIVSPAFWKLLFQSQLIFFRRAMLSSLWIWIPGFLEFLFLAIGNRQSLTRVMCQDLEYNGGHDAHQD